MCARGGGVPPPVGEAGQKSNKLLVLRILTAEGGRVRFHSPLAQVGFLSTPHEINTWVCVLTSQIWWRRTSVWC